MKINAKDPLAIAVVNAIQSGDTFRLKRLLAENPGLATARLADSRSSASLLHTVTDWPGHFPHKRILKEAWPI